jgi:hypothetical protein
VLLLFSGKQVHVSSIETRIFAKAIKVYNLEVEDWHTYFVSSEHLLVHNKAMPADKTVEQLLAGKGQLKDLRANPNLKGEDINSLLKNTLAELEQMAKDGDISKRTLKQIKKAFEGRDLGGRGRSK